MTRLLLVLAAQPQLALALRAARATALVSRMAKEAPVLPVRVAESLSVEGDTQTVVCLCSDLPRTIAGAHEWMRRCTHEWEVVQCRGQWKARGKDRSPTRTTKTAARGQAAGEAPVKRRVLFCSLQAASQLAEELADASLPVDLLVVDTTGVHPKAQKPMQLARLAAHDSFFAVRHRLVMQIEGGPSLAPSQPVSSSSGSGSGSSGAEAPPEELCIVTDVGTSCLGGDAGDSPAARLAAEQEAARIAAEEEASAAEPAASAPRAAAASSPPPDPIARRLAGAAEGDDDAAAPPESTLAITGAATGADGLLILSTEQMRAALARAAPATPLPESPEDLSQPHATAGAGAVDLALAVLYIFLVMADS